MIYQDKAKLSLGGIAPRIDFEYLWNQKGTYMKLQDKQFTRSNQFYYKINSGSLISYFSGNWHNSAEIGKEHNYIFCEYFLI